VHQVVEVPSQLGGVKLELLPVAAAATTAADAPLIAASNGQQGQLRLESSDNTAWNVAAYLSGSVGLVLLGTGVLLKLGEPTESAHAGAIAPCTVGASADDCAAQQRLAEEQLARADEASAKTGTSATTRDLLLFGSGGALLIAGIALLVFQPRSRSTPAASLQLSLAPFSLSLRTTFF
jgi:hypothetical protein